MKRKILATSFLAAALILGHSEASRAATSISPGTFDFNDVAIGTNPTTTFTGTISGLERITSVSLTDNVNYTIVDENCTGLGAPPDGNCSITVQFNPTVVGAIPQSELRLASAFDSTQIATLDGTGVVNPEIVILPSALELTFPDTNIGSTSGPLTMEIHNQGFTPLENIAVSAPVATEFAISQNDCTGASLLQGESCLVQFTFTPGIDDSGLTIDEIFTISADDVADTQFTVHGTGIGGIFFEIFPQTLEFGNVGVGTLSPPLTAQVRNAGNLDVNGLSVAAPVASEFIVVQDACTGRSLVPGETCLLTYQFKADDFEVTEDIEVSTVNAGTGSFTLHGIGVFGPAVFVNPDELIFEALQVGGTSLAQSVQVTNTGTSVTFVHGGDFDIGDNFAISSSTCDDVELPINGSCFVNVVCQPGAVGNLTDTLLIESEDPSSPAEVGLTCTGTSAPPFVTQGKLQIKANVLNFVLDTGASSSQSTTVTNIGTSPVTVSALSLDGDSNFSQTNDCEGATLNPGDTCTVTASFAAGSSQGNFASVLSITSNPATEDFLVLTGAAIVNEDTPDSGGCSLGAAAGMSGSMLLWLGLPISGLFLARFRRRG